MNWLTRVWRTLRQQAYRDGYENMRNLLGSERDRVAELELQVQSMSKAAQACAEEITCALPALEDGDWGLLVLTRKLTNELADARAELLAIDEALALEKGECRAHRISQLSCKASIAMAVAEALQVPVSIAPNKMMEVCRKVIVCSDYYKDLAKTLKDMATWLGQKEKESLRDAVQRVICTAEVAPGAAKELQAVRRLLDIPPGETVLQALRRPIKYLVKVNMHKGAATGVTVGCDTEWPPIGDVEMQVREL